MAGRPQVGAVCEVQGGHAEGQGCSMPHLLLASPQVDGMTAEVLTFASAAAFFSSSFVLLMRATNAGKMLPPLQHVPADICSSWGPRKSSCKDSAYTSGASATFPRCGWGCLSSR